MAGPVSDRNSIPHRVYRNSSKAQYDINGMPRLSGSAYRGHREQVLSEEIVTEGDRQLQELLKKQTNTRVSLEHVLSHQKEFSEGSISQQSLNNVSGAMTLDSYDRCVQSHDTINELRQAGLSEEEIALTLNRDSKNTCQLGNRRNDQVGVNPLVMADRLKEIDRKLDEHKRRLQQPTKFAGAKVMSRQEMDLEQVITKNREKTKQFNCLVTDGFKSRIVDPNHPINHLNEILKDLSSKSGKNADNAKKNQKRKLREPPPESRVKRTPRKGSDLESENDSDSDGGVVRENFDVPNRPVEERVPEFQGVVLLPDGTKAIQGYVESIPEDVIRRFRLAVEQIRMLPRFENYSPGEPSSTIYLKNLCSRVTETDLVALFHRFERPDEPKVVFRLLKGRMKGQAFVRFSSIETATEALSLVNGYDFKGKPIIIEYGKRGTSTAIDN